MDEQHPSHLVNELKLGFACPVADFVNWHVENSLTGNKQIMNAIGRDPPWRPVTHIFELAAPLGDPRSHLGNSIAEQQRN